VRTVDPTRIVQQGYDDLDDTYRRWVEYTRGGYRSTFLARILEEVAEGTDVLEIGCGPGTDAAALAEGRRYVGIDLSDVQLTHARVAAQAGWFLHGDVLDAAFPPASFDAVVSFYAFNHIPQDRMELLFRRIRSWLRPEAGCSARSARRTTRARWSRRGWGRRTCTSPVCPSIGPRRCSRRSGSRSSSPTP
jgi:SAM-dependent methyltransferase